MNSHILTRRARASGREWQAYETIGLGISVGKVAHEGADFEAAIEMMASFNRPCIIRLSDTLQRHNLMAEGMGAGEAWKTARQRGDEWLRRNTNVLARLPSVPEIVRWDDVIGNTDFENVLMTFSRVCTRDVLFAQTLAEDIEKFLARRTFSSHEEKILVAECSRAFLIEELAGQTILGRRYKYAGFYPGSYAKIFELVRSGKVETAPKGLENTAFISFSLRSKPQQADKDGLALAS